ncbi:NAD-binding protein [Propionivibrio limicola]|uniref:NAD-binding protein n=1 Tax=Propionivibrio limicola TaxID=167645 RepID=UPI00129158B1|nr:NAD-binding protein [Propionivibrio limicola]
MNDLLFVILRRLRRPLIVLVLAYAVSVWGLVLIPGVDAEGNSVRLGFFHALYIVSYTATTIGFGEIPHAFTDAQRAWTVFCIYATVVSWAYALGSIFHLSQDQTFRDAITRRRFAARVAAMQESFIVIVGYGQSGMMLARMLDRMGVRMVIVEARADRAARIEIDEFEHPPIFLAADARLPDVLVDAGVTHRKCLAMVSMAASDDANQAVAIGGTVLNPSLRIIARVHTPIARANLESFKKIELVNPYESFAHNMRLDMGSPEKLRVIEWLTGIPGGARPGSLNLPKGHWVICGEGSFADYVETALTETGNTCSLVDNDPLLRASSGSGCRADGVFEDLVSAGIERAVGLVACTDDDPVNLATVTRARSLKSDLYVVIRQVNMANAALIDASMAPLRFVKAEVVAHKARQLLTSPLLIRFLRHLDSAENSAELVKRAAALLETHVGDRVPFMWGFDCYLPYAGIREALEMKVAPPFCIGDLLINPESPPERLNAVPLLLLRKRTEIPLPPDDMPLTAGDRILFAGDRGVEELQRRFQLEPSPLIYVRTGIEPPRSWLFRRLHAMRRRDR